MVTPQITLDELQRLCRRTAEWGEGLWECDRRQFLNRGLGVLAAFGMPVHRATAGSLSWERRGANVVLRDSSSEYWTVTPDILGPARSFEYGAERGRLWLQIASDLNLGPDRLAARVEIEYLTEWRITLAASYLKREATASLHEWLAGRAELSAPADIRRRLRFSGIAGVSLNARRIATRPDWTLDSRGPARVCLAGGLTLEGDRVFIEPAAGTRDDGQELRLILPDAAAQMPRAGLRIGTQVLRLSDEGRAAVLITRPHAPLAPLSAFVRPVDEGAAAVARLAPAHPHGIGPSMEFGQFLLGLRRSDEGEHRVLFGGVDAPRTSFSDDVLSATAEGPQWAVAAESLGGTRGSGVSQPITVSRLHVVLPGADIAELIPRAPGVGLDACLPETRKKGDPGVCLDPFRLRIRRAADMLDLQFSFVNVELRRTKRRLTLRKRDEQKPALIRVHFPPQVLGDEAYFVQRDLKGGAASINPEDLHWKTFPIPLCDSIADPFARETCRRTEIVRILDQAASSTLARNDFAERDITRLRPRTYAAGSTRLVFTTPAGTTLQRDWSVDALLDWNTLDARVNPRAAPVDTPWRYQQKLARLPLDSPRVDETSIEAPFGIQLSPLADPSWVKTGDVTGSQTVRLTWYTTRIPKDAGPGARLELWHTRLRDLKTRVIWARGFNRDAFDGRIGAGGSSGVEHPLHAPEIASHPELRLTFDDRDRHELVALSSVFGLPAVPQSAGVIKPPPGESDHLYSPGAIDTDRLFALSSVGTSVSLKGRWDPPLPAQRQGPRRWPALTIENFRSRHAWGAENLGRVLYRGFLFPLGVRVSLVKLTVREFERDPLDGEVKAPKLQRLFILLPRTVKFYPATRQPYAGRNSDLVSIEFLIERTPDLIPADQGSTGLEPTPPVACPVVAEGQPLHCWSQDLFWPQIAPGQFVSFPFLAKDQGNRTTVREGPQLFVSNFLAYRPAVMARVARYYNTEVPQSRKVIAVGGQRVGYAPPARTASRRAETAFETSQIVLGASLTAFDALRLAIGAVAAGNPVTITTTTAHGLQTGQRVLISGTSVAVVNGLHAVTVVDATRLTIPVPAVSGQTAPAGSLVVADEDGAASTAQPRWDTETVGQLQSAAQPPFYPFVHSAHVHVPAIQHMVGSESPATVIAYDDVYRDHGFSGEKNQIDVFARVLTDVPFDVSRNNANVGGVAAPNTEIRALSRTAGLVGGGRPAQGVRRISRDGAAPALARSGTAAGADEQNDSVRQLQSGRFDPAAMFATSVGDAKLLGTIRLADVIRVALSQLTSVPKFVDEAIYEGVEAVRNLFCGGTAPIGRVLAALAAAVDAQPDSAARQMLRARVAALQATAAQVQTGCTANDPAAITAGVSVFVRAGEDFINDVRSISEAPALLLPAPIVQMVQELASALAPFLPPFASADVVRAALRTFIADVIDAEIDRLDPALQRAIDSLVTEFQPTVLQTVRAVVALRARLKAQVAAVEDNLVARFSEVADVAGAHLDELLVLQQVVAARTPVACAAAADAITKAAVTHFGALPAGTSQRVGTLIVALDRESRAIFSLASNPAVPEEVRRRAAAIHEQLRVLCEAAIMALRRVTDAPSNVSGELAALCTTNWATTGVDRRFRDILQKVKALVLQAASPAEVVRLVRPLTAFLNTALDALPPPPSSPMVTVAAQPGDDYAELRARVEALVEAAATLGTEAVSILTRPAQGETAPQAIANRIQRTTDLVARVKSLALSARLNGILDDLAAAAVREWQALQAQVTEELLERAALAEQVLIQRVLDGLLPGALQGFDAIVTWYGQWEQATNRLITPPIRAALDAILGALPDATALQAAPLSFLAQPFKNELASLRDVVVRARVAFQQTPLTGHALRLLAEVGTRSETLARATLEQLARGELNQLVSLDGIVSELEKLVRAITPVRRAFRYEWATALKAFPAAAGSEVFIPLGGPAETHLSISSKVEVSLSASGASTTTELRGEIRNFQLALIPGFRLLAVSFGHVRFRTENGGAPAYDVHVTGFSFLNAFAFISALAELLDDGENGPFVRVSTDPPAIEAGFRFGADIISFGAFTLQNLRVLLAFRLPLNSQPATFVFALASREKPCLCSAGIYGGGFFLSISATPSKLLAVEGALEFGAVTAVKFGALDARGRVVAGLYFKISLGNSALEGYVLATGSGRIAWFGISVVLRVGVQSDGSKAAGSAGFEVSFEIGAWVKLTFGFTAGYAFAGGGTPGRQLRAAHARRADPGDTAVRLAPLVSSRPACGALPDPEPPTPCATKDISWWTARDRYAQRAKQ